ncbi:MAG: SAM-dependent methyltransferase [Betaproteobacteria bacterium]|nr:SAM-dependent methyltransferase [Betaproteobacteria bacterium]
MFSEGRVGALYLIPTPLGDIPAEAVLSREAIGTVRMLDYFIAENPKTARAFLKKTGSAQPIQSITINRLDHNTPRAAIEEMLAPLLAGRDAGLVSEVGCPGVADPGAPLVRRAHQRAIKVVPLSGPSSIMLALMASGLNGQQFAFHGYLPVDEKALSKAIQTLEQESRTRNQTQIFIETPYRNDRTLRIALRTLSPGTWLTTAVDLTLPTEEIRSKPVREWGAETPLKDRPCVFLFHAE